MFRIFPKLDDQRYIRLFYLAGRHQWTSDQLEWDLPSGLDERGQLALCRLITPVYLGEQSAMMGATKAIQELSSEGESSAQVYMASFMMDEARHLEAITRMYNKFGHHPIRLRELPDMLRYHNRMRFKDTFAHWVFGIMVSDLFAKHFYHIFASTQSSYLFGKMSKKILVDEGRHQAFAEYYLSDRLPHAEEGLHKDLFALKEDLLSIIGDMKKPLHDDAVALGIDANELFDSFREEVQERCEKIGLGRCKGCPLNHHERGELGPAPTLGAEECKECWTAEALDALTAPKSQVQ